MECKIKTMLPTEYGEFIIYGYLDSDTKEHVALVKGVLPVRGALCRVHSECLTGEVFGSLKCDCKEQLEKALLLLEDNQSGIIIYLRQEGRGIGLIEKLKAYELQHGGRDTVEANLDLGHEADLRDYGIAAQILRDLNVESIRMITNNPDKIAQIESYGIIVEERIPVVPARINDYNNGYLKTKMNKLRHILNI